MPLHPRTRKRLRGIGFSGGGAVKLLRPASYLDMLLLVKGARALLTDSGGLQKEAFILGTPCLTLRDSTEWTETVEAGANRLTGADGRRILRAVRDLEHHPRRLRQARIYGDGHAAERIAVVIDRFLQGGR
jgi:UDP-N-acetylglucosamine 2-epimerase